MAAKTRIEEPLTKAQRERIRLAIARRIQQIKNQVATDRLYASIDRLRATNQRIRRSDERLALSILEWKRRDKRLTLDDRQQLHDAVAVGVVRPGSENEIEGYRRHVAALAATLGVRVDYVEAIRNLNGYALGRKVIEVSPIATARDYATALHELGHCARPCEPNHHRNGAKYCPACEVSAWSWAMEAAAPAWTRTMHHLLRRSLQTYRKYGTPDQQREIDVICALGFEQERQRRMRLTKSS